MARREPENDLVYDIRFRRLAAPIGASAALSLVAGLADAMSLAGLASYLTKGLVGASGSVSVGRLSSPPVFVSLALLNFTLTIADLMIRERTSFRWESMTQLKLAEAFRRAEFGTQAAESPSTIIVLLGQINRAARTIGQTSALANNVVRALIYLVVAFVASWQVTLTATLCGVALVITLRLISVRTRALHRAAAEEASRVGNSFGDMASGYREIHLLNRWEQIQASLSAEVQHLRGLLVRSSVLAGLISPMYAVGVVTVGLAVGLVANTVGGIAASTAATAGILLIRALSAAQAAQTAYQNVNDAKPYVERVTEHIVRLRLARRATIQRRSDGTGLLAAAGVSLHYGSEVIVSDVSLDMSGPGGVAIVGPSGAGKSTMLSALSGLLPVAAGTVTLDGQPLQQLESAELGAAIGLLPQDPRLLHDTLRVNLTRPEVGDDDGRVADAVRNVALDATVGGFSHGLDTTMGRGAAGLSGGEMQRLALARLMINQPEIWLLDEPTSALDRVNADRAAAIISDAMADHLVVLVTHRPDLLRHCRRVVYMEEGRIVDDGSVAEVAGRHPFVADMVAGLTRP